MAHITRAMVEGTFRTFCKVMGLREATSWNDVGGFQLVKENGYWKIEEIVSDGGGVSHSLGGGWTTGEIFEAMRLAMAVDYIKNRRGK